MKHIVSASLLIVLMTGLGPAGNAAGKKDDNAWRKELLAARTAKDREMKTDAESPFAAVERLTFAAAAISLSVEKGKVVGREGAQPGAAVILEKKEERWLQRSGDGPLQPLAEKRDGAWEGGKKIQLERFTLRLYPSDSSLAIIVFDPQSPAQKAFTRLRYYPPTPAFVVRARVEKNAAPPKVRIVTVRNLVKEYYAWATLRFRVQGREMTLVAFKSDLTGPASHDLFIPFRDTTSGKETYDIGRFLEIPEPSGEEFDLDFNLAFNPLCNYSPAYNCPLPPAENELPAAIRAGEKTYPHAH